VRELLRLRFLRVIVTQDKVSWNGYRREGRRRILRRWKVYEDFKWFLLIPSASPKNKHSASQVYKHFSNAAETKAGWTRSYFSSDHNYLKVHYKFLEKKVPRKTSTIFCEIIS